MEAFGKSRRNSRRAGVAIIASPSGEGSQIKIFCEVIDTLDDLAVLSDEFENAATLSNWIRLNDTEGWNADKLEVHDVDTSAAGQMCIMPHTTSWYADLTGPLVYKEITGDFIVTTQLDVRRRNSAAGRPVPLYSLGGIMIRTPRATTSAAANPDPGPTTVLPWPPNNYTTDWQPDTENYIFRSYGNAGGNTAANQWSYEVKITVNGNSTLYYEAIGVPADESLVTLQAVRRGNTFLLLRKHGENGQWIIENRYTRSDMPATLQVGITTYTDWDNVTANGLFTGNSDHDGQYHHNRVVMTAANGFTANPDLVVDAEYFRFARPPPHRSPRPRSLPHPSPLKTMNHNTCRPAIWQRPSAIRLQRLPLRTPHSRHIWPAMD